MELVPPNSKKWLSTLVPPKATRRAKNNQSQRIFTLSEWCSAALFKHYYTIFLVFIQLQNMWIRSFRAFSPQKLHHLQRRRLEPFLSSSSRLLSPCPAFGCWSLGAVHSLTIPINENALWQLKLQDQQLFFIKRNCLLKTLSSSVYWMGPVYLVIFCYWVGPVPYLELFGVGPVEKNTL